MTKTITFCLDDSEQDLNIIQSYFDRYGVKDYQLFIDNGAFKDALHEHVGVYVIDHHIGAIKGIDMVRLIRARYGYKPYIIIMSNNEDWRVIVEYCNEHVFKYLPKTAPGVYLTLCNYVKEAQALAQDRQDLEDYKAQVRKDVGESNY